MGTCLRQISIVVAILLVCPAPGDQLRATAQHPATSGTRVLLLFDEDRSLPGLAILDQSLRATLTDGLPRVEFYHEALSLSQFADAHYEDVVTDYFREKYRSRQPQLIVAIMGPALQFLLRRGDGLFPGVPIVFCGADAEDIEATSLPKNVTGLLVRRSFAPTLDLALQLHPATTRVYVVGGTSPFDRHLQASARREFERFQNRVAIEYLTDLPMKDLLDRLKNVAQHSVVLYVTLFRDGAGNSFVPHDVAAQLAAAARAPVYVFVDQYVGLGPVGGLVYSVASHGRGAGEIALRVLRGEPPARIPVTAFEGTTPLFDARQLDRWGIDQDRLPAGAIVQWREPSLLRDYKGTVLSVSAAGIVLLGLVVGLLYERRERRRAELRSREQLTITAHLGRQLAMGEMATALAHELNQPLGTIRLSLAVADRMITGHASAEQLREILREIDREDTRATQIIQRQRSMLQKRELEKRVLDLNDVVRESLAIVAHEAESRRIRLDLELSETPCTVNGDQILLQQVIVNLVVNAMDAMTDTPPGDRRVLVTTMMTRHVAEVSVQDRGGGMTSGVIEHVFEPFVTTKAKGMGIGLAIVRGIVEAHGGTIQATNNPQGGAVFWFTLPAVDSEDGRVTATRPSHESAG